MKYEVNVDQIKRLWILELIIRAQSFKGAATRARISPSAVSQSLAALEKSVGQRLIIRNCDSVRPTTEALSILSIVRPAFEIFDRLNEVRSESIPKMKWLTFGAYESLAVDILPALLKQLKEKLPRLQLSLRTGRTGQLLSMVRKGELCSAIVTETDQLDRFYSLKIAEDRLGVYVSGKLPSATDINQLRLGSLAPGADGLPRYFQKFLRQLIGMSPSIISESFETLRAATDQGAIMSVLPHRVAMRDERLMEITEQISKSKQNSGIHGIYVVSPHTCDREEADFLAAEAKRALPSHA